VRVKPTHARAHCLIGLFLERKGDLEGAIEELRTATTLEPENSECKQEYERLLQEKYPGK
jgi:Flp pilus assembly protein TadD